MKMLVDIAAEYVTEFFHKYLKPEFTYHNLSHTKKVVEHSIEMIRYYKLSSRESRILQFAAWFHDTGYLINGAQGHEHASSAIMKKFCSGLAISPIEIQQIADCIMATKIPTKPSGLLEAILCDADSYHLGTKEFFIASEALRLEFSFNRQIPKTVWDRETLEFMQMHSYHTSFCRKNLSVEKLINMATLQNRIQQ